MKYAQASTFIQLHHTQKKQDHAGFKPNLAKEEMRKLQLIAMSREEFQEQNQLHPHHLLQIVLGKDAVASAPNLLIAELNCSVAHITICAWINQPDLQLDQIVMLGRRVDQQNQHQNLQVMSHTEMKKDGAMMTMAKNHNTLVMEEKRNKNVKIYALLKMTNAVVT